MYLSLETTFYLPKDAVAMRKHVNIRRSDTCVDGLAAIQDDVEGSGSEFPRAWK